MYDGYVLEGEKCSVNPDSHGRRVVPFSQCRKFKYDFCPVAQRKIFVHALLHSWKPNA